MNDLERSLVAAVDAERIKALTLDLVSIPSPTGHSRAAAEAYASCLNGLGLDVDLTYEFPESPNVAARLRGSGDGPALQLAGHIDTIPSEHAAPYFADGMLYGRGAADMKGALASIAECIRVLREAGVRLKGNVLVTAFGLHEAPAGHGEGLSALIKRGVTGDAAIVAEMGSRDMPISGKGMAIFEFTVRRRGEVVHELFAGADTPNPILVAQRLLARLQARATALQQVQIPYVGPESIFIGMVHSGDFYNRVPVNATIVGTRRHGPDKTFADVRAELEAIAAQVQAEDRTGQTAIDLVFTPIRESFAIEPKEKIVTTVRAAYQDLCGSELPLAGTSMVADASILIREGHIPTVYHGPWSDRAHADIEYIALDELVRAARMYVLAAVRFCGST